MATPAVPARDASAPANHGRRVVVAWLVLTAIMLPIVAWVIGPAIRPGHGSEQAAQQVFDNTVLLLVATPVLTLLTVFFAYVLSQFRSAPGETAEGPAIRGDNRIQVLWVSITSVLVLFLAGFGTWELLAGGAGGGQGPGPVAIPSNDGGKVPVQVIGQQWAFTYRYPTYGGVETAHLVLPAGKTIELHVTSLDAVHSFWAYELGVKADANPGVDNVAYVQLKQNDIGSFHIRCAELCGLWHGYMFDTGKVVSQAAFASWIKQQQADYAPIAKSLPPYAKTYGPDPQWRAG